MANEEIPDWVAKGVRRKARADKKAEREQRAADRETRRRKSEAGKARYAREQGGALGPAAGLQCEGSACANKESQATHLLGVGTRSNSDSIDGPVRADYAVLCPSCAKKAEVKGKNALGHFTIQTLTPENKEVYFNYLNEKREDLDKFGYAPKDADTKIDNYYKKSAAEYLTGISLNNNGTGSVTKTTPGGYTYETTGRDSDISVTIAQPSFDEMAFAKSVTTNEGENKGISTFEPPKGNRNTEYNVVETGLKPWNVSKEPYSEPGNMYTSLRNGVVHYHMAREGKPDLTFVDFGSALHNKPGVAAALLARHKQTVFEERNNPMHKNLVLHRALESLKEDMDRVPRSTMASDGVTPIWDTDEAPAGLRGRIAEQPMPARIYIPRSLRGEDFVNEGGEETEESRGKPKWSWLNGTKGIPCQKCDSTDRPLLTTMRDHKGRELGKAEMHRAIDDSKTLNNMPEEALTPEDIEDRENYKKYTTEYSCPDCGSPRSAEMDKAYRSGTPTQRENINRVLRDSSKLTIGQFKTILDAHRAETLKDVMAGLSEEADTGKVTPTGNFGGPTMLPVPKLGPEEQAAREDLLRARQQSKTPPMVPTDPRRILQEAHEHMFCEDCDKLISAKNLDKHIQWHDDMDKVMDAAAEAARNKANNPKIVDISDIEKSGIGAREKSTPSPGNPFAKSRSQEEIQANFEAMKNEITGLKKPENGE